MIIKNSLLLAVFGALSILLGILRDRLLATMVGVGPVLDMYNASFRIPDLLYACMFAFVTAGTVVPFLTKENESGAITDPRHKLSSITLFFAGFMGIMGAIIAVTLPLYAHLIVPGFTEDQVRLFITATQILMIQPVVLGITSLISCFAQMKNQFLLYGLSPLGYSFGIIFGILFFYPSFGFFGLIYGVLLGSFISFAIQAYSLKDTKLHTVVGFFSKNHIKELFHLAIPRTGVNVLTQLRTVFFTGFATTLGPGALTSYLFAQRISDAVTQIIQQSLTTASLPVLSKYYADQKIKQYRESVVRYVSLLGIVGVLASTIIFMFHSEIIWLLYGATSFSPLIAYFLFGFLLILPFQMMTGYFSISFYSIHDTRSVLVTNLLGTVVGITLCLLGKESGNAALLLGFVGMALTNFVGLFVLYLRKKLS